MKNTLKVALTIFAFSFLGLCVGLGVLALLTDRISEGGFTRWRSLGSPPERVTELLGIGSCYPGHGVYVDTAEDTSYRYCPWPYNKWERMMLTDYWKAHECLSRPSLSPAPPHPVDACVEIADDETATDRTQFALMDDGTVWTWHLYVGYRTLVAFILISPLAGGVVGVANVWYRKRRAASAVPLDNVAEGI